MWPEETISFFQYHKRLCRLFMPIKTHITEHLTAICLVLQSGMRNKNPPCQSFVISSKLRDRLRWLIFPSKPQELRVCLVSLRFTIYPDLFMWWEMMSNINCIPSNLSTHWLFSSSHSPFIFFPRWHLITNRRRFFFKPLRLCRIVCELFY